MRILLLAILCCVSCVAMAVDAEAVLQSARKHMPKSAWAELGSSAWAEAIEKAWGDHQDLAGNELTKLRLVLAEAWLAGQNEMMAQKQIAALQEIELPDEHRDRLGNILILAWRLRWPSIENEEDIVSAPKMLKEAGSFSKTIRARAHVAEAARLISMNKAKKALLQYDAAYALSKNASINERVTILQLRLTAMETAGLRQSAIADWFDRRKKDEAVKQMSGDLFSEAQSLLGKQLPAKTLLEGDYAMKAEARVLFVFATWSKGSIDSAPVIAQVLQRHADACDLMAISIDGDDSVKEVPEFLKRFALDAHVITEAGAWESQLIKSLHIEAVPTIMLINKKGEIYATDIHGVDAADTARRLEESLKALLDGVPIKKIEQTKPAKNDTEEEFP